MRFLMIDRLTELVPGQFVRGIKAITGSEDFFADHFPGNPVLPGVLIIETMAQTGGALFALSSNFESFAVMTLIENAKFRVPVRPGDVLDVQVTVAAQDRTTARVSARACVSEREVASAQIAYVLVPFEQVVGARYADFWRDLVRSWTSGIPLVPQPAP